MGNWFGKNKKNNYKVIAQYTKDDEQQRMTRSTATTKARIKVQMTVKQFEELVAQVDMSKGASNLELGQLIMQHYRQGKLISATSSTVVQENDDHPVRFAKSVGGRPSLSTIAEEKKY